MKQELFDLYEIAGCNLYDQNADSKLTVPNIQRGLVWKSIQMELLWDSILRGFPIGAMLILPRGNKGEILDGQQRSNAIISGFNTSDLLNPDKKVNTILWLDLSFKYNDEDEERRHYGIRLTNSSHPWGYDALGGKLCAEDRREALRRAYGERYPHNKIEWDIRQFVPHYFRKKNSEFLPVPLAIYVNAAKGKRIDRDGDIDNFWKQVDNDIERFSMISERWANEYKYKILSYNIEHRNDDTLLNAFFHLNDYQIVFNYVESDDDIEILFNRVNRRGTQMTETELSYAAIKHYGSVLCGCPNIGEIIKKGANNIMPEEILSQIIFRFCYSEDAPHGQINAGFIRKQALLKVPNNCIEDLRLYFGDEKRLYELLNSAKEILLSSPAQDCQLPNFLIAEIASNNPELFILLLNIIKKSKLNDKFVQSLVFYLYCFSNSNFPIRLIYAAVNKGNITEEDIRNIIRDSISREWCDNIILSFNDFSALDEKELTPSWNYTKFINNKGFRLFEKLFPYKTNQGCFMLKYAQRHYYKHYFGDFNPSNKEYWDEINRPWDHDHIIPQSWIPKDGDWRNCMNQWVNSMGNIADIPYEENRSKGDAANWDYYDSVDNKLLFYNSKFKETNRKSLEQGYGVITFLKIVKERFIAISNDFLGMFNVLQLEHALSPTQLERKNFFEFIQNNYFPDYEMCYRNDSGQEVRFDTNDIYSWQRPWLSLIKRGEVKFAPTISIYLLRENKTFLLERGNRNKQMTSPSDLWWEEGTWFRREVPLFEDGRISSMAKIICLGDKMYNEHTHGFVLDSKSLITYKINIDNIDINGIIYESYGCCHCSIISADNKTPLPERVLNIHLDDHKFNNNNNVCIDCYLSGKGYNINNVCDEFAKIMFELSRLK